LLRVRRRLPIAIGDSVGRGIDRVDPLSQLLVERHVMNTPDAADTDGAEVARTTAELLAAVNTSDADRCSAVWAADGVLMPPHQPSIQGHQAIVQYFRDLFSRSKFKFTFTSSEIHLAGDTALERLTYIATIWAGDDAPPIEDVGKGLHVYRCQPNGSWKLTYDIWNSDQAVAS
jgi:ketosteroid isomerase-like protein